MDRKLLDALNNLSLALEEISNALNSKDKGPKSDTTTALQSGNLNKKIDMIDKGVKKLQEDNKKILKNQETIIALSKKKTDETGPLSQATDPNQKAKLKDGLKSIMLIAIGVLAIGLAFKLIGSVDFLSVIALSIALPLVAIAFEKIAGMKNLNKINPLSLITIMVTMATAITLSSFILQAVKPVGMFQLFTAILIAGMFSAISYGIGNLILGMKKSKLDITKDWKILVMLPLALVAISLAIAGSSEVLQYVKPVGIFKLFTAVLIAAMFTVISFGLGKLLSSFKDLNVAKAGIISAILPIVLIAVSYAISESSRLLSNVTTMKLEQFFTSVMIAIIFIPISFALPFISKALKDIDVKKTLLLPVILVAMAAAIWLSSKILTNVEVIKLDKLFNIITQAITLAAIAMTLGTTLWFLSKLKPENLVQGGISLVILSIAVAISSRILSLGDYTKYPPIQWAISVGISMLSFGLAAVGLGILAITGVGALAIIAGAASILLIAGSMVAVDKILANGDFTKYPPISWSASMAISLAAFGIGAIALGTYIVGSLGIGYLALEAGTSAIETIAESMVSAADILRDGKFTGGPTKEWAEGISIALGAFSPVYGMLMANKIMSLFGGGVGPEDFINAIKTVSKGIVETAKFFNSKENTGVFDITKIPSEDWAKGVGGAIQAFSPVLDFISKNEGLFSSGTKLLKKAIEITTKGIVSTAKELAEGNYTSRIPSGWMQNVSDNVKQYVELAKYLSEAGYNTTGGLLGVVFGMNSLSKGYMNLAKGVKQLGSELDKIDVEKLNALKNLTGSIVLISLMDSDQFEKMMDSLEEKASIFVDIINDLDSETTKVSKGTKAVGGIGVKTGKSGGTTATMDDLMQIMSSVDRRLASIARSNDNLSKYVDEIRTSDVSLRRKTH